MALVHHRRGARCDWETVDYYFICERWKVAECKQQKQKESCIHCSFIEEETARHRLSFLAFFYRIKPENRDIPVLYVFSELWQEIAEQYIEREPVD